MRGDWVFAAAVVLAMAAGAMGQAPARVASPNGELVVTFEKAAPGADAPQNVPAQVVYSVTFHGKPLLERSGLRLDLADGTKLGLGMDVVKAATSKVEEKYRLVAGKASDIHAVANAVTLGLEDAAHHELTIEARVYDDAVAFRYVIPEQEAIKDFRLAAEHTEFRVVKDATTWSLLLPNFQSMYESEFVKLPLSAMANQGGVKSSLLAGCPMLLDVPGVGWMAITEADLEGNAGMYLVNPSGVWTGHYLESKLAPQMDHPELAVTGSLPHHSAWRVIQVADTPAGLINSNVLTNLNPPSAIADTSWIKGGKASWDWWSGSLDKDGKKAFTTENMKFYVDFAAESGFEYMLIDAGWFARMPDGKGRQVADATKMNGKVDVPAVCAYAKTKGVKVLLWSGYEALNRQMDEAFPLYASWGVAGVKTDFIERDDQEGIAFYYRAAKKAAENHLLIDFHGASKPWGMHREWPNVVGYEAVCGMEQSKAGMRDNPEHHVTLPFTRMLCGLMDYTPGGFSNVTREAFEPKMEHPMVMGTRAHQLAMYAVFESPMQMVSDHPGAYRGEKAFDFIKACPAVWDETKAIDGYPGEFVVVARRAGKEWYLGAMTNWTGRTVDVPLSFLGDGKFTATIYADAADADKQPGHVEISTQNVDSTTSLKAVLARGGGYAVKISPAP